MTNEIPTVKPFLDVVLEKNNRIDKGLVESQVALEKQLEGLGVDVKPSFEIEPALGASSLYLRSNS